jgi:hypothetical protein
MKVWIVDTGAYDNNHIDKIFADQGKANAYAEERNAEAARLAEVRGYRPIGASWDVSEYEVEA